MSDSATNSSSGSDTDAEETWQKLRRLRQARIDAEAEQGRRLLNRYGGEQPRQQFAIVGPCERQAQTSALLVWLVASGPLSSAAYMASGGDKTLLPDLSEYTCRARLSRVPPDLPVATPGDTPVQPTSP